VARIHRRKRIAEALQYREQGYSFAEIAAQMRISASVAHNMVVEGMSLITAERAENVLKMELARLDSLEAAHFQNAVEYGDLAATYAVLRI
jgi:hypothetical protein